MTSRHRIAALRTVIDLDASYPVEPIFLEDGTLVEGRRIPLADLPAWRRRHGLELARVLPNTWPPVFVYEPAGDGC